MTSPEPDRFARFPTGDILLDSNLLLLLLIGSFERQRIRAFKRTSAFSESDFDLLAGFLLAFRRRKTTPHILTEVSNLANALPEHLKPAWLAHFAFQVREFFEVYEESKVLMEGVPFHILGLTDAAICSLCADTVVVTEDFRLAALLQARNVLVLNMNGIRTLASEQSA